MSPTRQPHQSPPMTTNPKPSCISPFFQDLCLVLSPASYSLSSSKSSFSVCSSCRLQPPLLPGQTGIPFHCGTNLPLAHLLTLREPSASLPLARLTCSGKAVGETISRSYAAGTFWAMSATSIPHSLRSFSDVVIFIRGLVWMFWPESRSARLTDHVDETGALKVLVIRSFRCVVTTAFERCRWP